MKLWDWLAYLERNKIAPLPKFSLPFKHRLLYTNASKLFANLEGFIWSHRSITVLISPHQFTLTGWFLANRHFL